MIAVLGRVATLTTVYLLALTSLKPADVIVALVFSALIVGLSAAFRRGETHPEPPPGTSALGRLAGLPALIFFTLIDMCRGSWQVAGCCLGLRSMAPGVVSIPIEPTTASSAAVWAIRVGLAPDSVVVDVDARKGELLLHVLDASDPDAVRGTQLDSYRRAQRRVFP